MTVDQMLEQAKRYYDEALQAKNDFEATRLEALGDMWCRTAAFVAQVERLGACMAETFKKLGGR